MQTTPLNEGLVAQRFPLEDGFVAVPDAPGLGIDLDEERLQACLVVERTG